MGSVPRYYEYARDVAFLDFASLTGHDSQLVDEAWQQIRRETRRANRIGSFVGFMGYEWTVMRDRGGHHNVFFKNDPGRYVTQREAPRLPQLYQQLKKIDSVENILVIPHAHNPGDWNTSDDEVQRLVEIASVHGNFEYFGNRYLQNGYRVGLIGASDDHAGHPGSSSPLFATRNGLAAVYAEGPTREAIWESLRGRATYATSNAQRIVVRMTVGDQPVGTSLPIARAPVMEARVLGTAPIDHIDVVRNGEVVFSRDYLKPQSEAAQAVQLMFHSPTETPGTSNIPPLAAVMWQGWIEVSGAEIVSVRVLGQDHVSDEFHQVGATKAWFTVKTRGDFDGAWIRLTKIQPDASLSVRVASLEIDREGTAHGRLVRRMPGPPEDRAKHQIRFRLADAMNNKSKFEIAPRAWLFARTVTTEGTWDASFSYRPTAPSVANDYYYLRIVQIDGEAAWTSPVWIGK